MLKSIERGFSSQATIGIISIVAVFLAGLAGFLISQTQTSTNLNDRMIQVERHIEHNDARLDEIRREINQLERHDPKFNYSGDPLPK
jgi:cell division protein FtsL